MKIIYFTLALLFVMLSGCVEKSNTDTVRQNDGVVIALLDTGISKEAIDESCILKGYNYVEDNEDTNDKVNHGTAAASVIVGSIPAKIEGIAPDVHLVPLVVITKSEDGNLQSVTPDVLAQVIYDSVDKYSADIINISFGIKKEVPEVKKAVAYAKKQGVLVISAVGNNGEDEECYYPAGYDTVLAVGSHNEKGELSEFSQRNGTADILAPGEDIWLASKSGKTYGTRGTSYAAAYAAGASARLLAKAPELTPEELQKIFKCTAKVINQEDRGMDYCVGILDLNNALNYINDPKP